MKRIDDNSFDSAVLAAEKPVLVDFSAAWCGPCKMLEPILEKFAAEHPELEVVKLDVDESPKASGRFGVTAMPTLMLFQGGEVKGVTRGLQNQAKITKFVTDSLG